MGMTIAEKILAAHADRSEVKPGEFLWCRVGGAAGVPGEMLEKLGVEKLWDPQRVFVTEDHLAPPHRGGGQQHGPAAQVGATLRHHQLLRLRQPRHTPPGLSRERIHSPR